MKPYKKHCGGNCSDFANPEPEDALEPPSNPQKENTDPHQVDRESEIFDGMRLAFCCKVALKYYSMHHHGDEDEDEDSSKYQLSTI